MSDAPFAVSRQDCHLYGFSCIEEFCSPRDQSSQIEVIIAETGGFLVEALYLG